MSKARTETLAEAASVPEKHAEIFKAQATNMGPGRLEKYLLFKGMAERIRGLDGAPVDYMAKARALAEKVISEGQATIDADFAAAAEIAASGIFLIETADGKVLFRSHPASARMAALNGLTT